MQKLVRLSSVMASIALALGVNMAAATLSSTVYAAEEGSSATQTTRRTPALRVKVYDQLSRAQTLADAGNTKEAIKALDEVKDKSSSMNSYELAMLYNFYAFIHYNAEQYDQAIAAFEQVVAQQPIPESFEQSTLFSLAQLHMMRGNYDKSIEFMDKWETLQLALHPGKPLPPKNLVLKAQAMYQKQDYKRASEYINQAVEQEEKAGQVPDENWYVLQRAVSYELKQPEKVKDVLVKLVKHYNQASYWVQLAGMYGELGQEKQQLAVLETAYQEGFVTTGVDLFNLAQLYYYHQVPFKAALVMQNAIDKGVLDKDLRNLKFLSQAWTLAKENDKAEPVMIAAAKLSNDGELDAQLGQMYLNMERWTDAIQSSERALQKGGLRNAGTTYLVMGMAYFNIGEYHDAIEQLSQAEKFDKSKGMAKQWAKYVETEMYNAERLTAALSNVPRANASLTQ
jgi:tetratricopeptide (TPR) repeat protein